MIPAFLKIVLGTAHNEASETAEDKMHYKPGGWSNISVKLGTRRKLKSMKIRREDGRKESFDDIVVRLIEAYQQKVRP